MRTFDVARNLFGGDFLGADELALVSAQIGIKPCLEGQPIPARYLDAARSAPGQFLLILGASTMSDGTPLTICSLRNQFGTDPGVSEPCFYNQDWYISEYFARKVQLEDRWYLIRKEVDPTSRGKTLEQWTDQLELGTGLPTAVLCAYVFFVYYIHSKGIKLWEQDYIWCSDLDHQGDRVYVGRYVDPLHLNKNGFSVHRHLQIRENHGISKIIM